MKKKVNNGIRIVAFVIILVLVLRSVYGVLSWKDTTGDYLSSTQQLYATQEELMDVVFLGSSHCYCGIYPAFLWRDYGFSAFDMAVSGQDKASTYHTLVEVLKTQNPKVVCVDLYGLLFERHAVEGNVLRNMLALRTSSNSVSLVKEYVEPGNQQDYLARWPIVHTRYAELQKYDFETYAPSTFGRGAYMEWHTTYAEALENAAEIAEATELSTTNREWLSNLLELSREEDFSLIFYMAPCLVSEEEQKIVNGAAAFAEENGLVMLDFNRLRQEIGLDSETDFVDNYHCNALGAEKVTGLFGIVLLQGYDLEDHRGDEAFYQWEEDLRWYKHLEFANKLQNAASLTEVVDLLLETREDSAFWGGEKVAAGGNGAVSEDGAAGGKVGVGGNAGLAPADLTYVVSLEGNFEGSATYFEEQLYRLGIDRTQIGDGGKWVIDEDGSREVNNNDSAATAYVQDLGEYDSLRIRFTEDLAADNIQINREDKNAHFYNMTILVYDEMLQELAAELSY